MCLKFSSNVLLAYFRQQNATSLDLFNCHHRSSNNPADSQRLGILGILLIILLALSSLHVRAKPADQAEKNPLFPFDLWPLHQSIFLFLRPPLYFRLAMDVLSSPFQPWNFSLYCWQEILFLSSFWPGMSNSLAWWPQCTVFYSRMDEIHSTDRWSDRRAVYALLSSATPEGRIAILRSE